MTPRTKVDGVIECWKYSSSPALVASGSRSVKDADHLVRVRVDEECWTAGHVFSVWVTGTNGAFVFHGESKIAALTTFANVAMLDDVRPESLLAMGFESFVGGFGQGSRRA